MNTLFKEPCRAARRCYPFVKRQAACTQGWSPVHRSAPGSKRWSNSSWHTKTARKTKR